jgi:DNA polymerase I-like protein with 3'-5' exonuclease and polymerase domains
MTNEVLSLDTEITFSNKGSPYDKTNKLVCYSWAESEASSAVRKTDSEFDEFTRKVANCSRLVLFNAKFDLAWCLNEGLDLRDKNIWDVQLAEFILSRQTNVFPSLEGVAQKYGLGHKIDVVKSQYWEKGINTDEIPWEVLKEYAEQDAVLTLKAYHCQLEEFKDKPNMLKLFRLQCNDLLILLEMERNGLVFSPEIAEAKGKELESQLQKLQQKLGSLYPDVQINFGSPDQLSCFLYGGSFELSDRVVDGVYKTGSKKGEPRYRIERREVILPRLFEPLKGSERDKEGYYGTSIPILKSLSTTRKNSWIIDALLEVSRIEKLLSTYYIGLLKINKKMNWEPNVLHGQYNQVRVATGRLSSSNPNLQNLSGDALEMFPTRFT